MRSKSKKNIQKSIAGILITIMISTLFTPGIGASEANLDHLETGVINTYVDEIETDLDKRVIDGAIPNELHFPANLGTLINDKTVINHGYESGDNSDLRHGGGINMLAAESDTKADGDEPADASAAGGKRSETSSSAIGDEISAQTIDRLGDDIDGSASDDERLINREEDLVVGTDGDANASAGASKNAGTDIDDNKNATDVENPEGLISEQGSDLSGGESSFETPTGGNQQSNTTPGQGSGTSGNTNGDNPQTITTDENAGYNWGTTEENEELLGEEIQVNTGSGGNPSGNETPLNPSAPAELDPTGTTENAIEFDEEPVIDELDDILDEIYDDLFDLTLDAELTFEEEVAKFQADVWGTQIGDIVTIHKTEYLVMRKETKDLKKLVLIMEIGSKQPTLRDKREYEGSKLQNHMTLRYNEYYETAKLYVYRHIRAMAVIPELGDFNSEMATSEPTTTPASSRKSGENIFFAPSIKDLRDFGKDYKNDGYYHPSLSKYYAPTASHWSRTPAPNPHYIYGWKSASTTPNKDPGYLQDGLPYNATYVHASAAVWVNTSPLAPQPPSNHNIHLKVINFDKRYIQYYNSEHNPNKLPYDTVMPGETYTLKSFPIIEGVTYAGVWTTDSIANPDKTGPVSIQNVSNDIIIIVYYKAADIKVKINYILKQTGAIVYPQDTDAAAKGETYSFTSIPTIPGLEYTGEWIINGKPDIYGPEVSINNLESDIEITLFYDVAIYDINILYVDIDTLSEIDTSTSVKIKHGLNYTMEVIPTVVGYQFANEWWDVTSNSYKESNEVTLSNVISNKTLILFYNKKAEVVDLIISKTVKGGIANKNTPFTFFVSIYDTEGSLNFYEGYTVEIENGVIDGSDAVAPSYKEKSLDGFSMFSIELMHGQKVTMKNIPKLAEVLIIEIIDDSIYTPSYEDSAFPGKIVSSSGKFELIEGNDDTRTISFTNESIESDTVDIVVSKTVTGQFANKNTSFTFVVTFMIDNNEESLLVGTQIELVGGVIDGLGADAPSNKTIAINEDAEISFKLMHGQTYTMKNISKNEDILITEIDYGDNYIPYFKDSNKPSDLINFHSARIEKNSNNDIRTISFINERYVIPPTGLSENVRGTEVLMVVAALFATSLFCVNAFIRRRKKKV